MANVVSSSKHERVKILAGGKNLLRSVWDFLNTPHSLTVSNKVPQVVKKTG
jgi:hypothetical protein